MNYESHCEFQPLAQTAVLLSHYIAQPPFSAGGAAFQSTCPQSTRTGTMSRHRDSIIVVGRSETCPRLAPAQIPLLTAAAASRTLEGLSWLFSSGRGCRGGWMRLSHPRKA